MDLIIDSTFWPGAAASILLLDPMRFPVDRGWRYAFGIGALLGLGIIFLRHWVPESPRWRMTHGRNDEAQGSPARSSATSPTIPTCCSP